MKRLLCSTLVILGYGLSGVVAATELTLDSRAFLPMYQDTTWNESSGGSLICTGGIGQFAAQLDLPQNSTLQQFSIWGGDLSASEDATATLARICQAEFISSSPGANNLASIGSSGSAGAYYDVVALNLQAFNTNTCTYSVVLTFGNTCTTNLSVAKVRIVYTDDRIFAHGFE